MPRKSKKTIELVAIQMAIDCFESKAELAKAMETTSQNINRFEIKGTFPSKLALKVERITNGKVKAIDILKENEAIENGLA